MRRPYFHLAGMMLVAASIWCSSAAADPVIYVCTSKAHSGAVWLKLDDKLKTASMGRAEGVMVVPDLAIFNRETVTWSHVVEKGVSWNYSFAPVTGILTYGPAGHPELAQKHTCEKKWSRQWCRREFAHQAEVPFVT